MKFFRVQFSILFFLLVSALIANTDSLKSIKKNPVYYFHETGAYSVDSIRLINDELNRFEVYANRLVMGNIGLSEQILFNKNQNSIGFNYFNNPYLYNYYTKENIKYYHTRIPYSDIFYVAGSKKEQFFKMTFSHNVRKNWNLSIDFKKIRSEGFYLRQNVAQTYLAVSTNYKSKNERYFLLGNVVYNAPNHTENGGIKYDSIFESNSSISKNGLGVNLVAARKKINNRQIYIKQHINIGKKFKDSLSEKLIAGSVLSLASRYEEDRYKYSDDNPLDGFYDNIYIDSIKTNDSLKVYKIENELEWKRLDNNRHRGFIDWFGINLKIKHQFVSIQQHEIDTLSNNVMIGGGLYNVYSNFGLWYLTDFSYCLTGYNEGDYIAKAEMKKDLKLFNSSIYFVSRKQSPDFIYNNYLSNHFQWKNDFKQQKSSSIGIVLNSEKYLLNFSADYTVKSNVLYFDTNFVARQDDRNIPIVLLRLKKDFSFYGIHLDNDICYQYVQDSAVIRLPEFTLNHSLYYESDLFKKALKLQFGVSVLWFSGYYANAYMPATSQFYLQNDRVIGNYPFFDFFINAKIKTVRIFLKLDHFNSGLSGNNYFIANHYPINDRAFKIGISWQFYD